MAHGTLHPRGEHEPDIELHLMVYKIVGVPPETKVILKDLRDWWAAPVAVPEIEIDYMNKLVAGKRNVFYIPFSLAKEIGLCEKCFCVPRGRKKDV